jgi:aquaporin Z
MMTSEWWVFDERRQVLDSRRKSMTCALKAHWPEYLIEAVGLGVFMISACAFTVLLYHPSSPAAQFVANETFKRILMGMAMGSTAIAIIFSPLGKRSGAHINPAVTLTYFRLGKIQPWDAAFYTLFQFTGGIAGVLVASLLLNNLIAHQSVNYAATVPGPTGPLLAFLAELLISFILMSLILTVSNTKRLGRWTGLFAGALIAIYISIESPLSGMSMNPARTFGSAFGAHLWTSVWIYFTAPPLGMLLAAEVYKRIKGTRAVACAKLHHHNDKRCIFRCNFQA